MLQLVHGGLTVGSLAVAMFFLRFYRASSERLFAFFASAFAVLAVHWALLGTMPIDGEYRPLTYLLRLAAFVLILVAIIDRNRRP